MAKQWVLREQIEPDLIRHLLYYRGIKTKEETEKFLNFDYEKDLHNPFDILNIDKAVKRILQAIKNKERIVIFGDYDADGVCACSIFYDFFKKIGFNNFHIHIPDRNFGGYGLTLEAIDEFIKQKANLIITLDCGITDYKEVEKANSAGIDVIIIDHHLVSEKVPEALAILDSKQEKDNYPFKYLCGAGVTFKVIQALIERGDFNIVPGWEKWLLDAVAIATVADMVPLVDENRTLVFYGLEVLKKTQRQGLIAFYKKFNIDAKNITEDDIAFMIAPKINVASRLDHANTSFELMTTDSFGKGNWIAAHLDALNNDRKIAVEKILEDIDEIIKTKTSVPEIIVIGSIDWHPGILGIVANRLVDNYKRPVFIWGKGKSYEIKGSCRSDGSVNLVELMKNLPKGILTEHGGHALAGGFSVNNERLGDLKEIKKAYKKINKQRVEKEVLYIDKELTIDDINWDIYAIIKKLSPFGVENPKPIFLFNNLEIINIRKFGNKRIHLQLDFKKTSADGGGEKISAIGFFMANGKNLDLQAGQKIDLLASLEKSTFRNYLELRLKIVDIKVK